MNRHKTPLRYPGGKQRLAPFIRELLLENGLIGGDYVEPYAGGAGVAIELLLNGDVRRIYLNDSSTALYAFWHSILNYTEEFCRKISEIPLTVEEWRKQRNIFRSKDHDVGFDLGFSLFYLNRCNRSGIPNAGIIGGLHQSGEWKMDARFPKQSLINRIHKIAAHAHSITLSNLDAEIFISNCLPGLGQNSLIYFDPPYFRAGQRLYPNYYEMSDHKRISELIQKKIKLPWVVSYDCADEIIQLYKRRKYFIYTLHHTANQSRQGQEVFFFSQKIKLPFGSAVKGIDSALRATG